MGEGNNFFVLFIFFSFCCCCCFFRFSFFFLWWLLALLIATIMLVVGSCRASSHAFQSYNACQANVKYYCSTLLSGIDRFFVCLWIFSRSIHLTHNSSNFVYGVSTLTIENQMDFHQWNRQKSISCSVRFRIGMEWGGLQRGAEMICNWKSTRLKAYVVTFEEISKSTQNIDNGISMDLLTRDLNTFSFLSFFLAIDYGINSLMVRLSI